MNNEVKIYNKEHIKSLVRNYEEQQLETLKGKVWLCRLEYYDNKCSGAASCVDCLGVPANFEDFVLLIDEVENENHQ